MYRCQDCPLRDLCGPDAEGLNSGTLALTYASIWLSPDGELTMFVDTFIFDPSGDVQPAETGATQTVPVESLSPFPQFSAPRNVREPEMAGARMRR